MCRFRSHHQRSTAAVHAAAGREAPDLHQSGEPRRPRSAHRPQEHGDRDLRAGDPDLRDGDRSLRVGDPDLRAGDREREAVAEQLRDHAAAGRLSLAELEERLGRALTARTRRDLRDLVDDLPALAPAPPHPVSARAHRGPAIRAWLVTSVALVVLWALTGADAFWPVWPILGWGIPLALRASHGYGPRPSSSREAWSSAAPR